MKILALASALALLASPALAQNSAGDWFSDNYDVVGSAVGDDPGCIMASTFDIAGRSSIKFAVTYDGEQVLFSLSSADWSAVQDQVYDGFYYYFPTSEEMFSGGTTVGFVYQYINKGFVTGFGPEFLDFLSSESRLMVSRQPEGGEFSIVADLNLTGSAAAVTALRRCVDIVSRREAARIRREAANDYIARDPF